MYILPNSLEESWGKKHSSRFAFLKQPKPISTAQEVIHILKNDSEDVLQT